MQFVIILLLVRICLNFRKSFIADLISDDRDYKDVKKMRKYSEQSLEKAMLEALKFSISDSVEKGNTIPVSTLEAYNDFAFLEKKSH